MLRGYNYNTLKFFTLYTTTNYGTRCNFSQKVATAPNNLPSPTKGNLLTKLRRSTGYPVGKCQQALKLLDYDYERAKAYLREKAEKENWDKAAKLQYRATHQGLVGTIVARDGQTGCMVELNCETDFVTKSPKFGHLMEVVLHSLQNHLDSNLLLQSHDNGISLSHDLKFPSFKKYTIDPHVVKSIPLPNSKCTDVPASDSTVSLDNESSLTTKLQHRVQDSIAQAIGNFGENIAVRRVVCMQFRATNGPGPKGFIGDYCHSVSRNASLSSPQDHVSYGKYGALVALQISSPNPENLVSKTLAEDRSRTESAHHQPWDTSAPQSFHEFGEQMAQHVVGMNPREVGDTESSDKGGDDPHDTGEAKIAEEGSVEGRDPEGGQKADKTLWVGPEGKVTVTPPNQTASKGDEEAEGEYDADEFDQSFYKEYYANLRAEEAKGNEKRLVRQDFLLDASKKVSQVLDDKGACVVDFVRFECGEEQDWDPDDRTKLVQK